MSPFYRETGRKYLESQMCEKNVLRRSAPASSKVNISYLSVIHCFISLILLWFSRCWLLLLLLLLAPFFLSGTQRAAGGGAARKYSRKTWTAPLIKCRWVPPRSWHLNTVLGSRKGPAKRPMWPPGVLYIGPAATPGPPGRKTCPIILQRQSWARFLSHSSSAHKS